MLWCWRCQEEVPMLDEVEYAHAFKLYGQAFEARKSGSDKTESFKPLLDYYQSLTGLEIEVPNAIMHHRIAQYGPPCEACGKPLRTPKAAFCAACGERR
jgi:hypothetical protein